MSNHTSSSSALADTGNSSTGGFYGFDVGHPRLLSHPVGRPPIVAPAATGSIAEGSIQNLNSFLARMSGAHSSGSSGAPDQTPTSLFFHYPLCRGSVPPARWAHAAAVVGNVLWVYGGVGNSVLDDLCALDADTLSWRIVSSHAARSKDRPEKMLGHAAVTTGSKIWIFGGQQGRKFLRTLYCFDTETCTWTRRDSDTHPPARAGHSMVTVHGSVVYMFGGQGKRLYNDLYKLDPSTGTFTEVEASGKPPTPRRGHSLVWDGRDYLVCFGGISQSATDAQLSVFSLSRGTWFTPQAFGPAPSARTQHSAQLLSPGVILIFGGCNSSGTFFNDALVLDTRSFTWHKPALLNTAPAPRYHHTCSVVNGRTIIYGGINSKQTFDGVVVLETMFPSDISSVAEELFRMSADVATSIMVPGPNVQGAQPAGALPPASTGNRILLSAVPGTSAQAVAQSPLPPGSTHSVSASGAADTAGMNSSKTLENVKIQLTDLLLRRNLEEQQLHTARKAETTETLLAKEREAREAIMKELLQYKLLLAEAEANASSAQQDLQAALAKSNRDAAEAAALRSQMEIMQAKLSAREEELQEARLLQDGLVKELGIMASRYSRLAVDMQDGCSDRTGSGERGHATSANAATSSSRPSRCLSSLLGGRHSAAAGSLPSARGAGRANPTAPAMLTVSANSNAHVTEDRLDSGSYSVPLPEPSGSSMTGVRQAAVPVALSTQCTTSLRTSAGSAAQLPTCGSCCQQLLSLLSDSEVHRASLMEANQALSEKVDELTNQNNLLYGQLQQMHAEAAALEGLSLRDMEELERKLESAARAVRDALMQRKIDEAQRRSNTEHASCAVCMEGPKAVVFNCGHQSCEACSGKMTSCPFCRVAITARIRLFDA